MGVSSSQIVQAYMSEACMHLGVSLPVVYSVEAEAAQPRCDFIMGTRRRRLVRDLHGLRPHGDFHDGAFEIYIGEDHSILVQPLTTIFLCTWTSWALSS